MQSDPIAIRQKFVKKRLSVGAEENLELSRRITARLLERLPPAAQLKSLNIGLYQTLPGELDLAELIAELMNRGARLHFPRVYTGNSMEMVHVPDPLTSTRWEIGKHRIRQPEASLPPADPTTLDLIVVPGVVFGEKGERLGRGAGYYDRFLSRASSVLRLALAADFQLVETLPQESWDEAMHWILTDQQEIRLPRCEEWFFQRGWAK